MQNENMILTYRASVYTDAGWRDVEITAAAHKISEKRAVVNRVVAIDGASPSDNMSRTGSKRQSFNGVSIAKREVNVIKVISKCLNVSYEF